jgi:hypothetical protein
MLLYLYNMYSGVWVIVVVPAVLAFVFSIWVITSVLMDLSVREQVQLKYTVGHTVRMKVPPPNHTTLFSH